VQLCVVRRRAENDLFASSEVGVTQLGIEACGPQRTESLSQFYTPPVTAQKMVESIGDVKLWRVLEPACGLGALVKPLLARGSGRLLSEECHDPMRVVAYDIDARNIDWCRDNIADPSVAWWQADYLTEPTPCELYDLCLMNSPYEGGLDGDFLAKAMSESQRIVALIKTESLHGVSRYNSVWSKCSGMESPWILRTVSAFIRRPNFGGNGGQVEFSVVKLSRRTEEDGNATSCVEWWT
jgi:predicted RNA methylase